jgi:hypothetical protein
MRYLLLWLAFGADVRDLGADDFAVREAAEARLSRYADLAYPLLARRFEDLEQRRRAERVLAGVFPRTWRPIAMLSGRPLLEWARPGDHNAFSQSGLPPGDGWVLLWLQPDPFAPLAPLVRHYHERARTQTKWRDWMSASDAREATRLLAHDLLSLGLHPAAVRRWLADN